MFPRVRLRFEVSVTWPSPEPSRRDADRPGHRRRPRPTPPPGSRPRPLLWSKPPNVTTRSPSEVLARHERAWPTLARVDPEAASAIAQARDDADLPDLWPSPGRMTHAPGRRPQPPVRDQRTPERPHHPRCVDRGDGRLGPGQAPGDRRDPRRGRGPRPGRPRRAGGVLDDAEARDANLRPLAEDVERWVAGESVTAPSTWRSRPGPGARWTSGTRPSPRPTGREIGSSPAAGAPHS